MGKLSKQISDAMTALGNDLTGAGWPAGEKDGRQYDTSATFRALVLATVDVAWLESEHRDCVNELCHKCGSYREEHLGACDGCRWKDVRRNG